MDNPSRILACLFILLIASNLLGQDESGNQVDNPGSETKANLTPTQVYIQVAEADLMSGPSKDYYPTRRLKRGTALDAYRRTNSGWLAVRPPSGSFSWIRAKEAYLLPGGKTIEITDANSVSWIGTELGTAKHYRWQVDLQQGEQLVVLGESTKKDSSGNETLWYKIAPPHGEFRWIHESAVSEALPAGLKPQTNPRVVAIGTELNPTKNQSKGDAANSSGSASVVTAAYQENSEGDATETEVDAADGGSSEDNLPPSLLENTPIVEEIPMGVFNGEGEYIEGEYIEGEIIDGGEYYGSEYIEGEVYGGEIYGEQVFDGEHLEGEVIYEDGSAIHGGPIVHAGPAPGRRSRTFDNWHAFDLTDDGLHFTWLERLLGRRGPLNDPLQSDPFSLSIAKSNGPVSGRPTRVPPGVIPRRTGYEYPAYEDHGYGPSYPSGYNPPQPLDKHRPWRDPRSLRQNRLNGYPELGYEKREAQDIVASIRDSVGRLGDALSGGDSRGYQGATNQDFASQYLGLDPPADFAGSGVLNRNDSPSPYSAASSSTPITGGSSPSVDWFGVKGAQAAAQAQPQRTDLTMTAELDQIQVALGEMVSRPPALWNLQSLRDRTQYFIKNGTTPVERGQARLLLDRIDEFEQHAHRTAFVPGMNLRAASSVPSSSIPVQTASYSSTQPTNAVSTAAFQSAQQSSSTSSGVQWTRAEQRPSTAMMTSGSPSSKSFDATGYLVSIFSSTAGQPSHALTDQHGKVIAYVTGLSGMNLDLNINQPVGIYGRRGFLPQLQKPHIQAERVIRL